MYLDNNNHFYGEIDGKNIYSYLKKDYKLNTVEERIDYINEWLEESTEKEDALEEKRNK